MVKNIKKGWDKTNLNPALRTPEDYKKHMGYIKENKIGIYYHRCERLWIMIHIKTGYKIDDSRNVDYLFKFANRLIQEMPGEFFELDNVSKINKFSNHFGTTKQLFLLEASNES